MKPKRWNKRRKGSLKVPRSTIRETIVRSSGDCVDTMLNYWNPNLSQRWSIPLSMLLKMGGWTLKMMRICSIWWRQRAVNMSLYLIRNYRISWFCTCKVRLVHGFLVALLWSWKNHGLNKILRPFSLFHPGILYSSCHFLKEVSDNFTNCINSMN